MNVGLLVRHTMNMISIQRSLMTTLVLNTLLKQTSR